MPEDERQGDMAGGNSSSPSLQDAALVELERQFKATAMEFLAVAALCAKNNKCRDNEVEAQIESIMARLQPIESAIATSTPRTQTGFRIKARHTDRVIAEYLTHPQRIEWDECAARTVARMLVGDEWS